MKQFGKDDVQIGKIHNKGFCPLTSTLKRRLFAGGWGTSITRELMERGDAMVIPYIVNHSGTRGLEQFRMGAMANTVLDC